ncbi:tail assembly chaperone [Shewanella phage Spp001]|uniref:Uncharacterized protein n=1 Tax=Shewanella phage Spp001 TaxID=1445859 RepID=W6EBT1_9CAUD|nr:tail assembly chaperone [Shewanella phage Spp001]AHJ10520.1 hypothetical protein Spp001_12 [Shewanella phage Spp001]
MACKDKTITIGNSDVYARQWPASLALENLSRLLRTFGNNADGFIAGDYVFRDCMQALYTEKHKEVVQLIQQFCMAARTDGKEIKSTVEFDQLYSGDLQRVFKVFSFVCELNYKDFFDSGVTPPEPDPAQETPETTQP